MRRINDRIAVATAGAVVAACAGPAFAQSLYERPEAQAAPAPSEGGGAGGGGAAAPSGEAAPALDQVSLIAVTPPEPPSFGENDLITIIISEKSKADRSHEFENDKGYLIDGQVFSSVDLMKLLELRLQQGRDESDDLPQLRLGWDQGFEAEAEYEREDEVTARVTARVVEVKPNGTLLLEARTVIKTDTEEQTITLSGYCRTEDVTAANTVQSNQMYDLNLNMQHTGDVRDGGQKGWIPRILEAVFNF